MKNQENLEYDLCIIGAGPSGYAAAMRAMDLGKRTALIEKNNIGGAGLFDGALSSKTLWEISEAYSIIKSSKMGFSVFESELEYTNIIDEMNSALKEKYYHLKTQIDYYRSKNLLDFYKGFASIKNKNEIVVESDSQNISLRTKNIILAVGSKPRKLNNIQIDEKTIVTSDGVNHFKEFPESIVILGAGVIGCEFATIFSNFGKTKVFLIDKQDRILPFEDDDLSNLIAHNLEKNGVTIHRGASLVSMEVIDNKVEYKLSFNDGREEIYNVSKGLISIGRVPNIENLGLENVGLEINQSGHAIDTNTKSNVENIYVVGDFTADIALVNIAELEGRYAVEKMFGLNPIDLIYENTSSIMFLKPEVAVVGINELQAKRKKIPYKMASFNYKFINRAIAMRETEGFFKLIVTDDEEMKVLGMRVIGSQASSTIEAVSLLISLGKGIRYLTEIIHPHPSITEGLQECARMLTGTSIIKPEIFTNDLKCYKVDENGKVTFLFN